MLTLKLVIFDLDGVLVDACEWHRVALNEALKEVCGHEISLADHYKTFNGLPTQVKLNKLTEKGIILESSHHDVYRLKQQKTIDVVEEKGSLGNDKIELIEWLKEKDIKVACFTNSIRETALLMLKKTGVHDLLELIVTNQDVKKAKPNPEGYIKVLEHFNIDKSSTIIVEDSPKGVAAAEASGCHVMQVKNPTNVNIEFFKEYLNENFNSNGG